MIHVRGGDKFKMDSILTSVKKIIGIAEEDESFDADIIMHINAVLMTVCQLGVGPSNGFIVTSKNDTWTDFFSETRPIEAIKSYIGLKVRLLFDPPTSGSVSDAIKNNISELEWRINVMAETSHTDTT